MACILTVVLALLPLATAAFNGTVLAAGRDTSKDECSCHHGFMPGIGIPGIGSLSCWSPIDCKEKCSSEMAEPCQFRALCTAVELGPMNCDCSLCKGPTKQYQGFIDHCEPSPCKPTETCYWDGCHFDAKGSDCMTHDKPLTCACNYPNALNATGDCVVCPEKDMHFDDKQMKWFCKGASTTLVV
eukprot:TRINITY_DN7449_c0_g1_i1.p2 TRINITY_DN7449_c0_g1~~TRINITY_DN7449_c0_g1_i1.p2  ORF type:complete len:185 (-),score=37.27 TRINITY_DN7449_c0_g1_i1:146-700(-)